MADELPPNAFRVPGADAWIDNPQPDDFALKAAKEAVAEIDAATAPFRPTLAWDADTASEPGAGAKPDGALAIAFGADAAVAPPDQSTVVRGLFHKGSITLIYGLPKSGKSFLATNAALAVADPDADHWMGHRIQLHGPVLYVACEGHGGFWKRLQAAGHVPTDFALATGRPTLIRNDDGRGYAWAPHPADVQAAIAVVCAHYHRAPLLVIIDTVFRSFGGGNVNDSSHMNAYVAAAQLIADDGCAIGLVHHTTKNGSSPAGSVSLMGASDTLVLVEKAEDGTHIWTVEEAKDDASGCAIGFRLEVVNGIRDASGDDVSSCILVPLGSDETPAQGRHKASNGGRKPDHNRLDQILAILARLLNAAHGPIHVDQWRDTVYRETRPGDNANAKRVSFIRDRDKLVAQGRVIATGDMVDVP